MRQILQTGSLFPQYLTHLPLKLARNTDTVECPVCSFDAIESPALAFFNEVFAVRRFGSYELGNGGEGVEDVFGGLAG